MNRIQRCLALLLALCMLTLSSCGEGLMAQLGFDTHDYEGEAVLESHAPKTPISAELSALVSRLLLVAPALTPFTGAKEGAELYRDAILLSMLRESYARYAGNKALIQEAETAYPGRQIQILIPAEDFESVVYEIFGGSEKAVNKSGEIFAYLDRVRAYTTPLSTLTGRVAVCPVRIEETERTYRLYFYNTEGDARSPLYYALIIKREDGSLYIAKLEEKISE